MPIALLVSQQASEAGDKDRADHPAIICAHRQGFVESSASGSAADGFGEGFKLARDIGSRGLVRDFGRTLRFERCDAVAPSCAIERESLLREESPSDKGAIALVDRNQMQIVQCEMAPALGYCVIGSGPGFAVGNQAHLAPLEGGMEGDRRAVARSRDGARRTGIFALIEYRAQRQNDARLESPNRNHRGKNAVAQFVRHRDSLRTRRCDHERNFDWSRGAVASWMHHLHHDALPFNLLAAQQSLQSLDVLADVRPFHWPLSKR